VSDIHPDDFCAARQANSNTRAGIGEKWCSSRTHALPRSSHIDKRGD
jgi:hypothetical protein